MKTILFISFALLGFLCSFESKAQNLHLIADVQIFLEPTNPHIVDTLMMLDPLSMEAEFSGFDDSEEFKLSMSVLLLDTTEVYKIYVKAGRVQAGDDLFDSYFEYDNSTPVNGVSYIRNQKHIVLGIGNFTNLRNIYTEVYLENTNGVTTQLVLNHINQ